MEILSFLFIIINLNLFKVSISAVSSMFIVYFIVNYLLNQYNIDKLNYNINKRLTYIIEYFKFSKKDYEDDFDYILNFLKENYPYAFRINFDKIKKQKDKICNCKNRSEFIYNLKSIDDLRFNNIGHFQTIPYNINLPGYLNVILNKYNKKFFQKVNQNNYYHDNFNKNNKTKYKFKIIKNDKNQDSIYIKLEDMGMISMDSFEDLQDFIIENKKCKNMYIDIRDNPGGSKFCYQLLLGLIFKGELQVKDQINFKNENEKEFENNNENNNDIDTNFNPKNNNDFNNNFNTNFDTDFDTNFDIDFNTNINNNFYSYIDPVFDPNFNLDLCTTFNTEITKSNSNKFFIKNTPYNKYFNCYLLSKLTDYKVTKISNNENYTHMVEYKPINQNYSSFNYTGYKGHIYVIINNQNGSAAQCFIDEIKNNDNFTLYGDEPSCGFGYNTNPLNIVIYPIFICPKTKLIFRYEYIYYDVKKQQTKPQYKIPDFLKTKEIIDF